MTHEQIAEAIKAHATNLMANKELHVVQLVCDGLTYEGRYSRTDFHGNVEFHLTHIYNEYAMRWQAVGKAQRREFKFKGFFTCLMASNFESLVINNNRFEVRAFVNGRAV